MRAHTLPRPHHPHRPHPPWPRVSSPRIFLVFREYLKAANACPQRPHHPHRPHPPWPAFPRHYTDLARIS